MLFFWTFYSSKSPEKWITVSQKYEAAQLFFNIDNIKKCFLSSKQHIIIISEGSCDTEGWSNDAENLALHHKE